MSQNNLKDVERDQQNRLAAWFTERHIEIIAVILISVAAVLSSWCAYESARWGSLQAASYVRANASRVESLRQTNIANRQIMVDVNLFVAYSAAVSNNNSRLASFLIQRFPDRLKVATQAWLATHPMKNKNAPSSPFVMRQYVVPAQDKATELEQRASQFFEEGYRATETSDKYVLLTVLFAGVSFLAGVGSKFESRSVVLGALALGAIVGGVSFLIVLRFPIR